MIIPLFCATQFIYRGDLEGIVSSSVVDIMSEARDKESQYLQVTEHREPVTLLVQQVAEVSHREGVLPVVVGGVTIAFLYHENKP